MWLHLMEKDNYHNQEENFIQSIGYDRQIMTGIKIIVHGIKYEKVLQFYPDLM